MIPTAFLEIRVPDIPTRMKVFRETRFKVTCTQCGFVVYLIGMPSSKPPTEQDAITEAHAHVCGSRGDAD